MTRAWAKRRWAGGGTVWIVAALLVAGVGLGGGCAGEDASQSDPPRPVETDGGHVAAEPSADVITLDADARRRVGIRVEPLLAVQATAEHKAYGRVIDPTSLAEGLTAVTIARAAAVAAAAESERLRSLHADSRNVSARALEAAESDAAAAAATEKAALARLRGAWGSGIADRDDLGAFVDDLVAGDRRLVRVDLAAGELPAVEPRYARIETLTGGNASEVAARPLLADLVGSAASVDAATQGRGFYFVVDRPPPDLVPGGAVTGYLPSGDAPQAGVQVPRAAIVRAEGRTWVWLEGAGDALVRTQVALAQPLGDGWVVAAPELAGRSVVVSGAQELLSEALRDQIGGEEE